jgi:hypothetical protein
VIAAVVFAVSAGVLILKRPPSHDTSWKAMRGKDERDATEEEIAALEAEHGSLLPVDGEG